MHVHMPKPLHGWREFLGEVGIIVVGVLIALAGEQAVETYHWHHVVAEQRAALHEEIRDNLSSAKARVLQEPCFQRRLRDLAVIFARHQQGGAIALTGPVGVPAVATTATGAWDSAVGSQVLEHFPLKERLALAQSFDAYKGDRQGMEEEARLWDQMTLLDHPEYLSEGDWVLLRQAYSRLRGADARVGFYARWTLDKDEEGEKPAPIALEDMFVKATTKAFCSTAPLLR
jgi:inhibitor of KinA sporulation pathway (predicted exonuclease)